MFNNIFVIKALNELVGNNLISEFNVSGENILVSFSKIQKLFINPLIDEEQIVSFICSANYTTIETLNFILEQLSLGKPFPTQNMVATNIFRHNTTISKSFSDLKKFNIVYKDEDGRFCLSDLSDNITECIKSRKNQILHS